VLFDGGEFGTTAAPGSAEEEDFLGLPGLLDSDQVTALLRKRQADQLAGRKRGKDVTGDAAPPVEIGTRRQVDALRKELSGLVAAWHHRTQQPHGAIHAELRREVGGPPTALADSAQLQQRIDLVRRWAVGRR